MAGFVNRDGRTSKKTSFTLGENLKRLNKRVWKQEQ